MSKIEWTEETWNPVTGCTRVSEGCRNCYIERTPPMRMTHRRFDSPDIGATTGVQLHPERLGKPLEWRKPRRVFVNSMSDLFHDDVPDEYIAKVFGIMGHAERHTFQLLTKRTARMRALLNSERFRELVFTQVSVELPDIMGDGWPLPNVWIGTSVESQKWADIRISQLIDTPAAVRWISAEPLLGPVNLAKWLPGECNCVSQPFGGLLDAVHWRGCPALKARWLDWVVVGGETGPGARSMDPVWARTMRDQCTGAGVPFFFKQWGDYVTADQMPPDTFRDVDALHNLSTYRAETQWHVGKKHAGRQLDGREWNEYPAGVS